MEVQKEKKKSKLLWIIIFLLLLLAFPFVELALLISLADWIGAGGVFLYLVLSALLGTLHGAWAAGAIAIAGSLMLAAMFLTSVVFSFRDCFEAPEQSDSVAL